MSAGPTSRRGLLVGSAALAGVGAARLPVAAEPDPVFAALAAEKAAEDRWCALGDWHLEPSLARDAAERAWNEEGDRYAALFRRAMATVPTTAAGLVALVNRFVAANEGCALEPDRDGLTELLATVRTFITRENRA